MISPTQYSQNRTGLQNQRPSFDLNAKALGSYRFNVAYDAALKSGTAHHQHGSYRHDIAYTGALKSADGPNVFAVPDKFQTGKFQTSKTDSAHTSAASLKFTGANRALAPVLFSVPVITTFSALNQANSMLALAARDAIDSSGRVYQEFKRNKHGGRESFIEEFGTAFIWAFGIPWSKRVYDHVFKTISAGGKGPNIQFPDIDPQLLEDKTSAHRLTPELVEKYFQNVENLPEHVFAARKKQLLEIAHEQGKQATGDAGEKAMKSASKLLGKYRGNQFLKLFLCTFIPVLGIGFGIPRLNQWYTRKVIHQENGEKLTAEQIIAHQKPHSSKILRMAGTTHSSQNNNANSNEKSSTLHFGMNPGQSLSNWAGRLLLNDRAMSLDFVDIPLSSGRVITARNKDERIERLYREACMIFVLFFLQSWIQNRMSSVLDKTFHTSSDVEFKALKHLYDKFPTQAAEADFLKAYASLKKQMGVNGKLSDIIPDVRPANGNLAWHQKAMNGLRESFTGYRPPVSLSDAEKAKQVALLNNIREYFSNPNAQRNLLFDLSQAGGSIPTVKAKGAHAKGFIDITKKINEDGVKTTANYLDQLAESLAKPNASFTKTLARTNSVKISAFLASAAICWGVVSFFVPKTMHAITFWRTGHDEFPGVEGLQ